MVIETTATTTATRPAGSPTTGQLVMDHQRHADKAEREARARAPVDTLANEADRQSRGDERLGPHHQRGDPGLDPEVERDPYHRRARTRAAAGRRPPCACSRSAGVPTGHAGQWRQSRAAPRPDRSASSGTVPDRRPASRFGPPGSRCTTGARTAPGAAPLRLISTFSRPQSRISRAADPRSAVPLSTGRDRTG